MNLYAYVGNDPVNMVDPTGKTGAMAACFGGPIACGIAVAITGYGAYKLYDNGSKGVENTQELIKVGTSRGDAATSYYQGLADKMNGVDISGSEINKRGAAMSLATQKIPDALEAAGKSVSAAVPGTSMTGTVPTSIKDIAVSGAVELTNQVTNKVTNPQKSENNMSGAVIKICSGTGAQKKC